MKNKKIEDGERERNGRTKRTRRTLKLQSVVQWLRTFTDSRWKCHREADVYISFMQLIVLQQ